MAPLPDDDPILKELNKLIQNIPAELNDERIPGISKEVDLGRLDIIIEKIESEAKDRKKRLLLLLEECKDKIHQRDQHVANLKSRHFTYFESLSILHAQLEPWDPSLTEEQDSLPASLAKIQLELEEREVSLNFQSARVNALQYMSQLQILKDSVMRNIASNNILAATSALVQLDRNLKDKRTENLSRAAQELNHWVDCSRTTLIGMVEEAFWDLVLLKQSDKNELGSVEFIADCSESKAELVECMRLLDSLELTSQALKSFLEKELIGPLLRDPSNKVIQQSHSPNLKLELTKTKAEETYCECSLRAINSIRSTLEVFRHHIPQQLLPADFFENFITFTLRDQVLSKAIPTSKPGLEAFSKLADEVVELESWAGEWFATNGVLSDYVAQAEKLYQDKKRDDLLSMARAILLDDSPGLVQIQEYEMQWEEAFETPMKPNISCPLELPLLFPRCQVPDTVPRLVSAMEACLTEASDGQRAYMTSRNVVDLYLAMAPARGPLHPNRLKGAAMFHNECFYLAHLLLSLGFRFRHRLPCTDWVPCYLDFFPPLLALAHKTLALPLARHQEEALRLLQDLGDGGFRDLEQPARAEQADQAVTSVLGLVDELADAWHPLLPPRLFEATVGGQVLSPVCQWVVDQILDLVDIGERDSYKLQAIASKLATKVEDLLPHTTAQAQVTAYIQLEHLSISILTGSLARIKALHESGTFRAAFSNKQLAELVLALFGSSPARNEFVNKLLKSK
ncbi:ribosome biogenesis protein ytm1, variant 1 [Entomophthora muscae]|uniref:Ribosome biogenesis protein ytm1, variant 1 n=4 Tax=Entomophthora muscae TaxID=34485 RepID=A0ACC2TS92_9FUNG|nr:ribosome biogenesis protein ytm1, variant 1 [Entomophthora muscae]